jgi:hypothetical protein
MVVIQSLMGLSPRGASHSLTIDFALKQYQVHNCHGLSRRPHHLITVKGTPPSNRNAVSKLNLNDAYPSTVDIVAIADEAYSADWCVGM